MAQSSRIEPAFREPIYNKALAAYSAALNADANDVLSALASAFDVISQERIVAAAVFHGSTISLPPPARHHTILQTMDLNMGIDVTQVPPMNQGFLTNTGRFVNRVEGYYIAWRAGQVGNKRTPELFSEDMW